MVASRYPKLHKALLFAAEKHYGQDRDGEDPPPYITHPVDVVVCLRYMGGVTDEDVLCAGALHDLVEEAGVRPQTILRRFGIRVGQLVLEMTRDEPPASEVKNLDKDEVWAIRNRMLLDGIRQMSPDAWTIKLADRLSNLREALVTRTGKKRERYLSQSRAILEIIPRHANPDLWDALDALLSGQGA
jgi:(p)ppGpp synthase/HD superfamily hydrolase